MTTKNATHTPGPWYVGTGWIFHRSDERIGGSGAPLREEVCRVLTNDVGDANARLIAAAPELLAVLKDAEYYLALTSNNMCDEGLEPDDSGAIAKQARAAIAKAEGRGGF